jgi:WD40 repeat protein/serine/threonine protein kinase/TPR repeat protein
VADARDPTSRLKSLSRSQFSRLSRLLDESIDMTSEERASWLLELEREDPETVELLRSLYASQDQLLARGFLESQDFLTPHRASMEDESALTGKVFGPYRVSSLLGRGGMGSVWLAERVDGLFTRQVALKLLHPALVGRAVSERFTREREILASLNHPNIARLLDAGFSDDGQPYLALEYIAGTPLTAYCDGRRLGVPQRLELFQQVLAAVQYAHAHLIIHRDLKPSNILVTDDGQPHLLDFGIAKLLREGEIRETELTQMGGRVLTPDYAAPEQIAGAPITIAVDVYALGVMLYELLTGERPYKLQRDSRGALEEAILQMSPVPPSRAEFDEEAAVERATTIKKLAKTLHGDLDPITMKALKKLPSDRYATANAFDEDIARHLRGEAVLARRDSVLQLALKFARRHRLGIAVAGALLLTLAGGLAATSYEATVASAQRDSAVQAQLRSLTQTAAGRLKESDAPGAMGIILEVLPHRGARRTYTPEALSVFQEARAADAQILTVTGDTDRVRSVAFSSDGTRVVTTSYDKTTRIWDAGTGHLVMLLSADTDRVISAAFSPDGLHVVTGSFDKIIRIWDADTGREALQLKGHTDRIRSVAYSPDGGKIVSGSYDNTARIWDAATGREIRTLSGHTEMVTSAAFSSDGRRIVTASYDKTARIWNAETGQEIARLSGHTDRVTSAAFSPDNQRVITASGDGTARIWDAASGREGLRLSGHTQLVACAAFSHDGSRAVTASYDETARIWDTATGRELMLLRGHGDAVEAAAFSPDDRRVATASSDKTARIWDALTSHPLALFSTQHPDPLPSAMYSPDGQHIVTASFDKTARIWDTATGRETRILSGHTDRVIYAEFSRDGRQIVTASLDKTARIWNAATGEQTGLLSGHTELVFSAQFSPDGRRVVTASLDKTTRIWDAETGRQMQVLGGHSAAVEFAAYSPDGLRIATASNDKTARIWDAATGQQLLVLHGHSDVVEKAQFSPDGRLIVTASDDKTARIWDAATGRQLAVLTGHTDQVDMAAFSPDGHRVVTASIDRTARIWDLASGQQLLVLRHDQSPEWAVYSPDGRSLLTASDDGIARIWDASVPALAIQIDSVTAAQFDTLSDTARFDLGLPNPADARQWPGSRTKCDEAAAAPYDPDRRGQGAMLDDILPDIAGAACAQQPGVGDDPRSLYQRGRADWSGGKNQAARAEIEKSLAGGYRVAAIDLGLMLTTSPVGIADVPRAIALYEKAWNQGVSVAGFELGRLYESGVRRAGHEGEYLLAPDKIRAWVWYGKAAESGEPNALARFAERDDEIAFSEQNPVKRRALLLASFTHYADAAERARVEDWPDAAWKNWRYHRASLARLLTREGMMGEVAQAFAEVRQKNARSPTIGERWMAAFNGGS